MSTIQFVSASVADSHSRDELSQAVTKFWEVEEPLERKRIFSGKKTDFLCRGEKSARTL